MAAAHICLITSPGTSTGVELLKGLKTVCAKQGHGRTQGEYSKRVGWWLRKGTPFKKHRQPGLEMPVPSQQLRVTEPKKVTVSKRVTVYRKGTVSRSITVARSITVSRRVTGG